MAGIPGKGGAVGRPSSCASLQPVSGAGSLKRQSEMRGLLGFSSFTQRTKAKSEVPTLPHPLEAELGPGS